jgi:primary-amine oxidase
VEWRNVEIPASRVVLQHPSTDSPAVVLAHFANMSTQNVTEATPRTAKTVPAHPLAPLSASELQTAALIIRASWPAHTDLHFKVVTLQEPPKTEALKYLEAEHSGQQLPPVSRRAFINYYIRNTVCFSLQA